MSQDRLEYLKRKIKRTYKQYKGERDDGEATLIDVANFFNIPIDETRIEDYTIKNISFKEPCIEIYDAKTKTSYIANYTYNADLLNTYGGRTRFNRLRIHNPLATVDSIYYIGENTPLKSKISFTSGDYILAFTLENPHGEFYSNDGKRFSVSYSKNVDYEGKKVEGTLLTRVFKKNYKEGVINRTFEHLFTYSLGHYIQKNDSQNKFTYSRADNIIYGIQEHDERKSKKHMRGICFQNTNVATGEYLPYSIREDDYPLLKDMNISAAMVFNGSTGSTEEYWDRDNIEIYKNKDDIQIKYHVCRHFREEGAEPKTILDQVINLPIKSSGKLTLEELQSIIELLKTQYASDEFIELVLRELQVFEEKIRVNEGLAKEELDILSPKLLIDKSFAEIYEEVNLNAETYFDLAKQQFESATNIDGQGEKGKVKVLKSSDSSQNNE